MSVYWHVGRAAGAAKTCEGAQARASFMPFKKQWRMTEHALLHRAARTSQRVRQLCL